MYLYILISKKNIAVSSTIFVGRGRFALPKPHKWHSTYRRADLSTSKYFYFVLLSYLPKELWEKDSNLRPQGNEPCELPLLPSHDVIFAVYNRIELFSQHRQCRILTDERIDLQIVCLMSFYLSTRPLICSLVRHFGLASDVLASAIANKNSK